MLEEMGQWEAGAQGPTALQRSPTQHNQTLGLVCFLDMPISDLRTLRNQSWLEQARGAGGTLSTG